MAKHDKTAISPTRQEDYPEWYQQVVQAADLAECSPVRGCMVIKPWGYALWENIQQTLDRQFKATGHKNAYFPLFIPKSYLEREAEHVEGFAKECAIVTHSRLQASPDGGLQPASPLEEPLIVRPTSETIIGEMFAKWVQSYRDLPLLINQWANVVRWELRTRLFLRTTEFLWQEGHTVHATAEEAMAETRLMLQVYADFCRDYMAMPVITGEKTDSERFPGAINTFCIEAMMQDRKALQAGTSHFLGQNFAKTAGITFSDEQSAQQHAWTTSWGVSTRLIGGLVMTHSDDDGLRLPPKLAPAHVVILPVIHKEESQSQILEYCQQLKQQLEEVSYAEMPVRVELDTRDLRGGDKMWYWIKRGIPLWLEVGPKDITQDALFVGRRDLGPKKRNSIPRNTFIAKLPTLLQEIQEALYQRAQQYREAHTVSLDKKADFYTFFTPNNSDKPEIHGGFAACHWNGDAAVEEQLKKDLKVTIRCIPLTNDPEPGTCLISGQPSKQRVIFAKAY